MKNPESIKEPFLFATAERSAPYHLVITRKQRESLFKLWKDGMSHLVSYRVFRKTAHLSFGALMVPFHGMMVGIESDGYTHS